MSDNDIQFDRNSKSDVAKISGFMGLELLMLAFWDATDAKERINRAKNEIISSQSAKDDWIVKRIEYMAKTISEEIENKQKTNLNKEQNHA